MINMHKRLNMHETTEVLIGVQYPFIIILFLKNVGPLVHD